MTLDQLTKHQAALSLAIKAIDDALGEEKRVQVDGARQVLYRVARHELSAIYHLSLLWEIAARHVPKTSILRDRVEALLGRYQ